MLLNIRAPAVMKGRLPTGATVCLKPHGTPIKSFEGIF
jgi:hypothetical protein